MYLKAGFNAAISSKKKKKKILIICIIIKNVAYTIMYLYMPKNWHRFKLFNLKNDTF